MTFAPVPFTLVVCTFLLQIQAPPSAGQTAPTTSATGRISGRVVAADSGTPIENAVVRLVSFEVMRLPKVAATDAQGQFEFRELVPGRYQLTASAAAFVTLEFGKKTPADALRPIDLRAGEHFSSADVALPRTASISGVVFDEFGDPAPNVTLQVSGREFLAGRHRLVPANSRGGPTDDKGRFRLYNLPPGEYYLMAMTGVFTQLNDSGGFAITFHPGTTDPAAAEPIKVGPGEQRVISLAMTPAPSARVSGRILDAAGTPVARATVTLVPADRAGGSVLVVARGTSDPSGAFVFRNVPRGEYTLQAFGRPAGGGNLARSPFGWLPIVVEAAGLEDLTVPVRFGTAVRGRITFEGTAPRPAPNQVRVSPRPVGFDSSPIGGGPPPTETRADWTFEVSNMNGRRVIFVDVASPIWTVKQVLWKGDDVTDAVLDMREADLEGVEIVLSTSANASVTGTVTAADGTPTTDFAVVLFASDSTRWTFPSRFIAVGRPNQSGEFIIRGMPPASYLAVALSGVRGTEWQDPAFLEALRPRATLVPLGIGETRRLDLRIVR